MTLRLTRDDVSRAAELIRRGCLVAFPTETVYGLGANALDRAAVLKIFEAKQRPAWDPIIVHCGSVEMARSLVLDWPERAEKLAALYWPGPLTILLPKRDVIPNECTAGREKVGIRIPAHPVARALIGAAGVPIAAPSANRFGHTSPTTAAHVLADLDGRIDAILDGGATEVGVESTVIDISLETPVIYRPGGVTREMIETAIGRVEVAQRAISDAPPESLESPGLGIRHYAPRARVILVHSRDELLGRATELGVSPQLGVMLPDGWNAPELSACVSFEWGDFNDGAALARRLYEGLRWLDEQGVNTIVCPVPQTEGVGLAIYDRLLKAAK